jgi:flagellar biogenesis protein FliO
MTDADNLALLGRVMGGLIVVLVLIGLAARVARRTRGHSGATGLRVVDRVGLSREANLTVVEVTDRLLLLGVTAQGVTLLAELSTDRGQPAEQEVLLAPQDAQPDALPDTEASPDPAEVPDDQPENVEPQWQRQTLLTPIALEQYPDLASALRAAGRTSTAASPVPTSTSEMVPAGPRPAGTTAPRTRAELRAEARARTLAATVPTPAELDRIPTQRAPEAGSSQRVTKPPAEQASGSVLSPRTWRQGIEALRDLTVRRG